MDRRRALQRRSRVRLEREDNLDILAHAHLNLGYQLQQTGNLGGARKHIEQGTALIVRALGPNHPQIAHAKLDLADTLFGADEYDDAERLTLDAEAIFEKTYGPEYQYLAHTEENLGLIASYRGDNATARKKLVRAVQMPRVPVSRV